ncbi:MAG TPA: hypothetical protein VJ894_09650, partial [Cryomorphaceae bacterium]|nr:hypothetical protein [Cryomorphaceae bacterium]
TQENAVAFSGLDLVGPTPGMADRRKANPFIPNLHIAMYTTELARALPSMKKPENAVAFSGLELLVTQIRGQTVSIEKSESKDYLTPWIYLQ